jgi:molybdate transport system ATP-binding protein
MGDWIRLQDVVLHRPEPTPLFQGLSWTVRSGQTWAIVGPTGSGKSTLAQLLLGRIRPKAGHIEWPMLRAQDDESPLTPADVIEYVPFREESRRFSYRRHYYQQRFNFIEPGDDLTLDEFLRSGTSASESQLDAAATALGIQEFRRRSLIQLSNGQMRRARLARAWLSRPMLLMLDDPFVGLDRDGREDLSGLLEELVQQGQAVMLFTVEENVPSWVSHTLNLPVRGGVSSPRLVVANAVPSRSPVVEPEPTSEPIVELHKVRVAYGATPIVHDLSWVVRRGERWAVLGPNGSGKSTLLSLLCGDHPQAYSNDIRLFGRRRGSGETIWDIKSRVGLVSPELHLYFTSHLTAWEVVGTGWFDVLVPRPMSAGQIEQTRRLFSEWGLDKEKDRPFQQLSTGEQRLMLLARACVKSPELLILDEPFQGLDDYRVAQLRDWLDRRLRPTQTMIFVTHRPEELPRCVTRQLVLDRGQVVSVL